MKIPPDPSYVVPSLMDCISRLPTTHTLASYKDMVTGKSNAQFSDKVQDLEDDDIELIEDEIAIGSSNGIIIIDFSDRVQQLAFKSLYPALVVKVFGHRLGYNTLHNRIYSLWKPSHPIKLMDIENDFYLVKSNDNHDYLKVLTDGPWQIFCHYLTVEPWSINFQPSRAQPSRLMAWIQLTCLPITLYKRSFIEVIKNQIGSSVKIDSKRIMVFMEDLLAWMSISISVNIRFQNLLSMEEYKS
ncbi:hypothetical protein GQ457_08G034180 [Hibiscus cannabinus]